MELIEARIAVDIGGTFTDGVCELLPDGELLLSKNLTTHGDPTNAVSTVIHDLIKRAKNILKQRNQKFKCIEVVHGTTLITNAIIERKGAKVGLLVTEGTRDVLDMGRETRYDLYDLDIAFPKPLVQSDMRYEVGERLDGKGRVVRPLDEVSVVDAIKKMKSNGVEVIAVALLHAYQNEIHEQQIKKIIEREWPEVRISLSSRVASEIREYERTSTTVANAFVQPLAARYIQRLKQRLQEHDIEAPLRIMTSNGGFTSAETAGEVPIDLLESGPAGGVRSAINTSASLEINKILTFDMGGTTAKACVAINGKPELTFSFEAARVTRFKKGSGLPILSPSIDLIEIGAGGGSIAYKNNLGLLNVGPESAGSEPGPACYGLGGLQPTVTDADLVLGYLDSDSFLGGKMNLDKKASLDVVENLGFVLGISKIDTAWGIHDVVSENMASAARVHIAENGLDPRDLTMVATGGAGPVHAVEVAAKLGINRIIFTIAAGVGSCLGFLASPARIDRSWSCLEQLKCADIDKIRHNLKRLETEIEGDMNRSNVAKDEANWTLGVETRYAGQGHSLLISLPYRDISDDVIEEISDSFESQYEVTYGTRIPNGIPQAVTWRITAQSVSETRPFKLIDDEMNTNSDGYIGQRSIYVATAHEYRDVPVYQRYELSAGTKLQGPLILMEAESTIVVARPGDVSILDDGTVSVELMK